MRLSTLLALAALAIPSAHAAPVEVSQTIKTLAAQMKYDTEKFSVPPGAKVTVTFENHDEMPHNVIFCLPTADGKDDKGLEVAQAGWALGEKGIPAGWVPQHPRILAHSKLLDPHKTEVITFTAPEKPGLYPYVCSVPGHALIMNGVMRVQREPKPIVGLHYRYFEGNFDALPDFEKLTPLSSGPLPDGKLDEQADPATKQRKDRYGLEFEGVLEAPEDGEYEFSLASDDGATLTLDGKPILDNKKSRAATKLVTKKLKLKKGEHPIIVRYYQQGGGKALSLSWSGPGFEQVALSKKDLTGKLIAEEKTKYVGLPLTPTNEPIIYRNFIAGGSSRGIGVGLPGGVSVNWDANAMNVAQIWQGGFIDAKRHWTDRGQGFQPPSGTGIVSPVEGTVLPLFHEEGDVKLGERKPEKGPGSAIAALTSPDQAWPEKDSREAGYRYLGYTLNAKREPIFRYDTGGGIVTETFTTGPGSAEHSTTLIRTISYSPKAGAKVPPVYLRAAAAKNVTLSGAVVTLPGNVKLTIAGSTPVLRQSGGQNEVILPLEISSGGAKLTLTYAWLPAHQH